MKNILYLARAILTLGSPPKGKGKVSTLICFTVNSYHLKTPCQHCYAFLLNSNIQSDTSTLRNNIFLFIQLCTKRQTF